MLVAQQTPPAAGDHFTGIMVGVQNVDMSGIEQQQSVQRQGKYATTAEGQATSPRYVFGRWCSVLMAGNQQQELSQEVKLIHPND